MNRTSTRVVGWLLVALLVGVLVGRWDSGSAAGPPTATVAWARVRELPVFAAPGAARPVQWLANPTSYLAPLVLLVVDRRPGWLRVLLPVRPNGSTGWLPAAMVTERTDAYRVLVSLHHHRLTVMDGAATLLTAPVAVGASGTPTPTGTFYLTVLLRSPDPAGGYGPFAYGLSGHSPVLQSFAGGDGRIGLHGTDVPGSIGRSVTHGCIRVANQVITRLAGLLPLGTPVIVAD